MAAGPMVLLWVLSCSAPFLANALRREGNAEVRVHKVAPTRTSTLCATVDEDLTCAEDGTVLHIQSAVYGRGELAGCVAPTAKVAGHECEEDGLESVKEICEGEQSCELEVMTHYLQCSLNMFTTLTVVFDCVSEGNAAATSGTDGATGEVPDAAATSGIEGEAGEVPDAATTSGTEGEAVEVPDATTMSGTEGQVGEGEGSEVPSDGSAATSTEIEGGGVPSSSTTESWWEDDSDTPWWHTKATTTTTTGPCAEPPKTVVCRIAGGYERCKVDDGCACKRLDYRVKTCHVRQTSVYSQRTHDSSKFDQVQVCDCTGIQ